VVRQGLRRKGSSVNPKLIRGRRKRKNKKGRKEFMFCSLEMISSADDAIKDTAKKEELFLSRDGRLREGGQDQGPKDKVCVMGKER
jgi:hypothetical protein